MNNRIASFVGRNAFYCVLMWTLCVLALAPASALAQGQAEYVLGPEDVVSVTVVDMPKFSGDYLVPTSGIITMPVVGEVNVTGMTLEALRAHAVSKLKARLLKPEVVVSLKSPRARRVYVYGDVRDPGVLELRQGWRLSEALSAAGGLATGIQEQDVRVVLERANSKERIEMTLSEALSGPKADTLTLAPGDVLRITSVAMIPVHVIGKVKSPGIYRLREGESSVLAAIAQAGGVTEDANITSVQITRLNGGDEKVDLAPALIKGEPIKIAKLNSGDMVLVPESRDRFVIMGHVNKPGYYAIPSGTSYTLVEAIARAEGNEKRGSLSKVGLVRYENGKDVRKVYDVGLFTGKGDSRQNPVVRPGDVIFVPETNKVDILQILSGLASSALFLDRIRR
ncbi:MAG: SLBB domain-containing protein [Fimbriimonas sp.]